MKWAPRTSSPCSFVTTGALCGRRKMMGLSKPSDTIAQGTHLPKNATGWGSLDCSNPWKDGEHAYALAPIHSTIKLR